MGRWQNPKQADVACTLFGAVLTVIVENTHVNRVLKAAGLDEDASRIIIETYLHPLRCGTVPLTTSDAFPVIIVRSQCHLKETPALLSPHGWDIKSEEERVNECLGGREDGQ